MDVSRKKLADLYIYSTWTLNSTLKIGTDHTCPLVQDACSDLVTKCQDLTLQKKTTEPVAGCTNS